MNPALGGWLFIRLSWPQAFLRALDGSTEQLPQAATAVDQIIRTFFNKFIFPFIGAELPSGYIDLFSVRSPGIIADRAVFILVVSVAVIAAFEISRLWFSVLFLAVFGFLVRLAGSDDGFLWNGDVIHAFLSGGTLVAAFILVADPSSGAKSVPGNIAAVFLAAVLSFAFRYAGHAFYGSFFAVALVNALIPLFAKVEHHLLYSTGGSISKGAVASRGGGHE
jgi:electron transport complex protein RnfD